MQIEQFLARLAKVRKVARGWQACCPAHDDHNPSLRVSVGEDGRILLYCFAGCSTEAIIQSLGLASSDLFPGLGDRGFRTEALPTPRKARSGRGKLHRTPEAAAEAAAFGLKRKHGRPFSSVGSWSYTDRAGREVGRVYRFENPDAGPDSKQYRPVFRDGEGWRIGDPPGGFPLYRLPHVLASGRPVYVTEGEKAASALAYIGLNATTSAHGARAAGKADWSALAGRDVYLLPDNDPPRADGRSAGTEYVDAVARALSSLSPPAKPYRLELPDLPPKGDAVEFIERRKIAGQTDDEIRSEVEKLALAAPLFDLSAGEDEQGNGLPPVFLPGGAKNVRISEAARELGKLVSDKERWFSRGGVPVEVRKDNEGHIHLKEVTPASWASIFESVADLYTTKGVSAGEIVEVPKNCTKANAELICSCRDFVDQLPPLRLLTQCPVLTKHEGRLITVRGYHRPTGIYATGGDVVTVALPKAIVLLTELVDGFRFATPSDRSRALASLITPALVHGGLLGGRPPLDLSEADQSQAGKGYRAKLVCAIYRDVPRAITQRDRGAGNLEEFFSAALIGGACFISLENLRGKLASPALESALTEDTFMARTPYAAPVEINMQRIVVLLTSNKAELTVDMANRASPVLIRKHPPGHEFPVYPKGRDILGHVRANQGTYLGAVFSVVRTWWEKGCPRTNETRHDFRAWAQILDWIVQNVFHAAPLCDGLGEVKARMTTPAMNWLRDAAHAVVHAGRGDAWLRAHEIIRVLDEEGVEVPGLPSGGDLDDGDSTKKAQQATGRRLGQCFKRASVCDQEGAEVAALDIDDLTVERKLEWDEENRFQSKVYRFTKREPQPGSIAAPPPRNRAQLSFAEQSPTPRESDCGYGAAKRAAIDAAIKTPAAANAAMGCEHFPGNDEETVSGMSQETDLEKGKGAIAAQPRLMPNGREVSLV